MKRLCFTLIIYLILLTGCGAKEASIPKHEVFKYKNAVINIDKNITMLEIDIDSGNLEIFSSNTKEVKYEAKHIVRDNKDAPKLEKLLNGYSITSKKENDTLVLKISFEDKIAKPQDYLTEISLAVPARIKTLNINQKFGNLKIEDRYEGTVNAQLDSVNTEIGELDGKINLICRQGNTRIDAGELGSLSTIETNAGNIFVKAECENKSSYTFKTEAGNIDLSFPVSSNILLKSYGVVERNQFAGIDGDIQVDVSTKMGKITVEGH